jgi:nitric-oxide synthase
VLWSFERAGVKITDHHTESDRFLAHIRNERKSGREVPADWSWIVPPMSGGATGVFHRYYHEADQRPNFYLDAEARALATYGHHASRPAPPPPAQRVGPPPAAPSRPVPAPVLRPACPVAH